MNIKQQQIVNIQAYKHNGILYRQWNGIKVIEVSLKWWVLVSNKTKVAENKGQKWKVQDPTIWFFPLDEQFFNTIITIRENGINYYANIASPPIFEDDVIKFIDYDIDIKLNPGKKIKIMDEHEYKINCQKFNYSSTLRKKIMNTANFVSCMIKSNKECFDYNLIIFYLKKLIENKDFTNMILQIQNCNKKKIKKQK